MEWFFSAIVMIFLMGSFENQTLHTYTVGVTWMRRRLFFRERKKVRNDPALIGLRHDEPLRDFPKGAQWG